MSYVEKAFYSYLRSTLTGGIKVLLSKKYIFFTVSLVTVATVATGIAWAYQNGIDGVTRDILDIGLLAEVSAAIAFIVVGLLSRPVKHTIMRIIIFLGVFVGSFSSIFLLGNVAPFDQYKPYIFDTFPALAFISWCLVVPLSTFAFSKGFFSHKINGSILFLGKPKSDPRAVFSGVFVLIFFITAIVGLLMLITPPTPRLLGIPIFLSSLLLILVALGKVTKDDVFNTTMCFFYALITPNIILSYLEPQKTIGTVNNINFILVLFSLIYTAQNLSKRIKLEPESKKEAKIATKNDSSAKKKSKEEKIERLERKKVSAPKEAKKTSASVKEDPFYITKLVRTIGAEGVILIFLGLTMGFHLIQLKVLLREASLFFAIFGEQPVSVTYHFLSVLVSSLVLWVSVLSFLVWGRYREYFDTKIYRLEFLPPYEDLVDFLQKVRTGEYTVKDIVWMGAKQGFASLSGLATGKASETLGAAMKTLSKRLKSKSPENSD